MKQDTTRRSFIATVAAASIGSLTGCAGSTNPDPTNNSTTTPGETTSRNPVSDTESLTSIHSEVDPSIVGIAPYTDNEIIATGWVYDSTHIVTVNHALTDISEISVWVSDDGWYEARVIQSDERADVALLQVPNLPDRTPLSIQTDPQEINSEVLSIGYGSDEYNAYTTGQVTDYNGIIHHSSLPSMAGFLRINSNNGVGTSGGPFITADQKVTGMVTAGNGEFTIGHMPSFLQEVLDQFQNGNEYQHSLLKTLVTTAPQYELQQVSDEVNHGVIVLDLDRESPLQQYITPYTDRESQRPDIILSINDTPIHRRIDYRKYIDIETTPGDSITIDIYRSDTQSIETVTVETVSETF